MTLRNWFTFVCMAMAWGSLTHVAAHYAAAALNTYRSQQAQLWFEREIRTHLQ